MRLRPNPDSDQGYADGAVLEWSDDGKEWKGYFYIPHEAMSCIGQALIDFAENVKGK